MVVPLDRAACATPDLPSAATPCAAARGGLLDGFAARPIIATTQCAKGLAAVREVRQVALATVWPP